MGAKPQSNRSEGNLIHELDDSLPARVLLKAAQNLDLTNDQTKDVEYFVGLREGTDRSGQPVSYLSWLPRRRRKNNISSRKPPLFRIIAGTPSRGSIAIEDNPAPAAGSTIEVRIGVCLLTRTDFLDSFITSHSHRQSACHQVLVSRTIANLVQFSARLSTPLKILN